MMENEAPENAPENAEPTRKGSVDAKGRIQAHELTDRELMIETVILLRAFGDALEAAAQNPMLKAMVPGGFGR